MNTPDHFYFVLHIDGDRVEAYYPDTAEGRAEAKQVLAEARWDYPLSTVEMKRLTTSQIYS